MKNIHVLPTDKPSRFTFRKDYKYYRFRKDEFINNDTYRNQNIYITSDEEIKEGEYQLYNPLGNFDNAKVSKAERLLQNDGRRKKIILTDNKKLIKDGVQSIDDDFLEWFVKNPSCEFVEIKLVEFEVDMGLDESCIEYGNYYKIIIPKEEPKFENFIENAINLMSIANSMFSKKEEPKQETLEEALEKYCSHKDDANHRVFYDYQVKELLKWQQERSYSEEEVKTIINDIVEKHCTYFKQNLKDGVKFEWFKQFKKK